MAKMQNSLGNISGKIGNVVFYSLHGNIYVRRRPQWKLYVRSKNQKLWQARFKACISFYHSLNGVHLKPIWDVLGKLLRLSGLNVFISSNIQAFCGDSSIGNYEEIHLSRGVLKMPMSFVVQERRANMVEVCWDKVWCTSLDAGTDRLCAAVIYDDEPSRPWMAERVSGVRSGGTGMIELREGYTGRCHLYCFFVSEDGRCYSDDKYFRV